MGNQEHNQGGGEEPTEKEGGNEDDNDDGEEDREDGDKDGDNDESEDDLDEEEDEEEEEQVEIVGKRPRKTPKKPYEEDVEIIDFSPVAAYNGPLFHPGGCTMYNPRKVLRQLSCIQSVPQVEDFNFKVKKQGTKNTEKNFFPKYDPAPSVDHWRNFGNYLVPVEELQDLFDEPNAADEGYMEWYEHFSHPRVINSVQQARADKGKAKEMEKEA
ncbi:uncharacterized protein LOC113359221 [Papaver somniferum]|uniref:uncharacterized protein LOC113359221 n=1 Tax=Papaver somniferum TaxID=3469 RepID=UPI000E6FC8ED|nr:uncharacterized protein LOC113359221 [Papaver somniferum]